MVTRTRHQAVNNSRFLRISVVGFLVINLVFCIVIHQWIVASSSSCSSLDNVNPPALQKINLNNNLSPPEDNKKNQEFSQWLMRYSDTPGARLVQNLKKYLHVHEGAEGARLKACREKNFALCFGGHSNYHQALQQTPQNMRDNPIALERTTRVALHEDDTSNYTIWQLRRYSSPMRSSRYSKLRLIYNLGTEPSCLPLILVGAALTDGILVEMDTFVGLSSRCLAFGLNATARTDVYHAFDFFGHDTTNYNKISQTMPWVSHAAPPDQPFSVNSSYQWLWRKAMDDIYPTAQAHEGPINATTLHPKLWKKQPLQVLVLDSAKTWTALRDQATGLQRPYFLRRGAILVLMDFVQVDSQVKLVYSCLRASLQPVYSSYCGGEHWIFVVLRTLTLESIGACLQDFLERNLEPTSEQYDAMYQQVEADVDYMDGLALESSKGVGTATMEHRKECLLEKMEKELHESPIHWKEFISDQ